MTAFLSSRFVLVGCLAFAVLFATTGVMLVALFRKDRVKTGVQMRSFGFFLEASGSAAKKAKNRASQESNFRS
jgi:hypothetical protein